MGIQFDQATLQALVGESIFKALTPESRDELLKNAIAAQFEKPQGYNRQSPIQEAFNEACTRVARDIAQELLMGDTPEAASLRGKLREILIEGYEKATTGDKRQKLVDDLGSAMAKALGTDRY